MRWLAILLVVACGGRPAAPRPSPTVRDEVELAERAERKRQHDVARVHYERAIALARDPESGAYARYELAQTLAQWGEIDEAIAQLEASIELVDDQPGPWHDLGQLRYKQGAHAAAIAAFERARTLAPADPRPRVSLAAVRWSAGDLAGALAEYRALADLELPDRLRDKVKWAIQQLSARVAKP